MEKLNSTTLSQFLNFCNNNDLNILINRRQAHRLLTSSLDDDGDVELSEELVDKLSANLSQTFTQLQAGSSVSQYALVRHLGEVRRALRRAGRRVTAGSVGGGTPPASEMGEE